ncbi:MAG: hypothetical protein M0Q45_11330 [Bacteroidales bacterium]|nr:hypothetical protein [Bacteroidales bacterium]
MIVMHKTINQMQSTKHLSTALLTLLCALSFGSLAQEKRHITFHDTEGIPLKDVQVFHNSSVTAVSNDNGVVLLDRNITRVACHRLGYNDTLIYLNQLTEQVVRLTPQAKIKEVVVSSKHNPRKHLIRLRDISHELYKNTDTTIYYNFRIQLENLGTGEVEYMEGLTRVLTKVKRRWPYIYICKIDSFQYGPEASENSLFTWCDMSNLINENILLKRNHRWDDVSDKNATFERDWSIADSSVFHISFGNGVDISEVVFSGDTLKSFEFYFNLDKPFSIPKTISNIKQTGHYLLGWNSYIEYSQQGSLYPSFHRRIARYQTSESDEVVCKIVLSESDACTCNYDSLDNRYWSFKTIREQVEYIKKQVHGQLMEKE